MDERTHAIPGEVGKIQEPLNVENSFFKEKTFLPTDIKSEPSPGAYELIRGIPYIAKYFGISENLYKTSPFLQTKLQAINNFILKEIQRKNFSDDILTFNAMIGELKWRLKIPQLERENSVIDKLFIFIKRSRNRSAYKK